MIDLVQILDILCMQVIKKDDVFLCPFSCVLGVESEKKMVRQVEKNTLKNKVSEEMREAM